jgi:phosphoglycolate phosphatase-like HAD superfamily hydrolase
MGGAGSEGANSSGSRGAESPSAQASFDLVVLDLEGTLVSGRRPERAVWQALAAGGERRAWLCGLAEWERSGLPAARAVEFVDAVPAAEHAGWVAAFEAERQALRESHGLWAMPGAHDALAALRAAGSRLALATYAGPGAVELALGELGFGAFIEGQRCLDGRGPDDKARMLEELCAEFGTRSAILVGDSRSDADAALRAGLPCVPLAPEQPQATALGAWSELPAALDRRRRGAERLLAGRPDGTARIAVAGSPLAGAGLLARDLGRWAPPGVEVVRLVEPWLAAPKAGSAAAGSSQARSDWRLLVEVPREIALERRAGGAHFGAEGALQFEERWIRWSDQRTAARAWCQRRLSGDDPLRPAATLD